MTSSSHPHRPFPILIGSQQIYQGRVIAVRVDDIEVAPGTNVRREVVDHPGAVVIVPVDSRRRLLWVRQHRWAVGKALIELPAGTMERDESPETCAERELAEETGHAASSWQKLGGFFSAPGFCTEYLHVFAASGLRQSSSHAPDDDEDIELVPLSLDESLRRIDAGEIEDAKSIAAVHLYLRKRPS